MLGNRLGVVKWSLKLLVALVLWSSVCGCVGTVQKKHFSIANDGEGWVDKPQEEQGQQERARWEYVVRTRRAEAIEMLCDRKFVPLAPETVQNWIAGGELGGATGNAYLVRCVTLADMSLLPSVLYQKTTGILYVECEMEMLRRQWDELRRTPIVVVVDGPVIRVVVNLNMPYPG
jgi:hypothetical protein